MWLLIVCVYAINFGLMTHALALRKAGRHGGGDRPCECSKCGYNLTGNVSGRCPECGTPVQSVDGRSRS